MALNGVTQTDEEKENTFLEGYSARAVIHEDWIEWSITEVDVPLLSASPATNVEMQ